MDTSNNNHIFALDIGTRSVIGIVCKREATSVKIVAESMVEHDSRSMIDGQVHDVEKVAQIVMKVKRELEDKIGYTLKEAAIAAAGRALKTKCVHVEQDLLDDMDIDSVTISGLEFQGVSEASRIIKEESTNEKDHFYCVGYSIISYYLNGYTMTNLLNHRGRYIGADVLATFLPQSVVNGLYRVLDLCSLSVASLTLEPIAAIEAVVPENIRMLNLALVDIGAGTSDIAITKKGYIAAYGMVPVAGDEVTEAIAEKYLVDFNTAEGIKRSLAKKKKVSFKDITGMKNTVETGEVIQAIDGTIKRLAGEISKSILQFNGEAPRAIFFVGGGSQTINLIDAAAAELGMDRQRITVKKTDSIQNIDGSNLIIEGPEGVTVIGIAMTAFKKAGHDFINVYVNGREYRLFNTENLTIVEVLGLIGYDPTNLMGRSGKGVKFTLNGASRKISGGPPSPPEMFINDKPANLETIVNSGDFIVIKNALNGEDAEYSIIKAAYKYGINVDDEVIKVNGKEEDGLYIIKDNDEIQIGVPVRVKEAVREAAADLAGAVSESKEKQAAAAEIMPQVNTINVTVNGKNIALEGDNKIFVDIFNKYDFDLSKPAGNIKLKLNGKDAGFSDKLKNGDIIEVFWEK
ncbi:cell division protein FtsA [Oxobacter pfennigii]|uniref:Cell division protein FtsA n=1 Tax=Oxobacter pfennigii TaxID=36849 RepID=A0A0P8WRD8_9CLOT|nr:cell division FtsA domain-containing protein [Oxobacter pfennigii]KPU45146.1 cell division protein FtsA [Oxobacter pfennigii]